jgi:hypothetical protein
MNTEIPSYAPKQNSDEEKQKNTSENDGQEQDIMSRNERKNIKTHKSKKKIIIPILIIVILGLAVESYFFFNVNKNSNTINSYNYWFSTAQPGCDVNVQTNKPNSTNFFNQICAATDGYKYVSSSTNIKTLIGGAIESYTIIYKNDNGDQIQLIASSFNDSVKQSTYFNDMKNAKQGYVWQNQTAVYVAIGNNSAKFAESLNV